MFNNFGQTTNGQVHKQYNTSEDEVVVLKALVEQIKDENQVLKDEVTYLKTVIDRLLKEQTPQKYVSVGV